MPGSTYDVSSGNYGRQLQNLTNQMYGGGYGYSQDYINRLYEQGASRVNQQYQESMKGGLADLNARGFYSANPYAAMTGKMQSEKGRQLADYMTNIQGMSEQLANQNKGMIYQSQSNRLIQLEQMAKQYGYDLNKMSQSQIYALENMAKQQQYNVANMGTQNQYSLEQMARQQQYAQANMALQQEYYQENQPSWWEQLLGAVGGITGQVGGGWASGGFQTGGGSGGGG